MDAATRVFFNTLAQYFRTIFSLIVSLYSTRLVLEILGVTDYGIYSLIAGVVVMLSFIRSSLATTTQRFMSFYYGKKDFQMQKKIFTNSVTTQFLISVFIVLFLIIIEPFLFNGFLNIPIDKIYTARLVYKLMIITVFVTMQSIPFYAVLIAHENITFTSIVQVIEVSFKLIYIILPYFSNNPSRSELVV